MLKVFKILTLSLFVSNLFSQGKFLLILGPSGSGKSTIINNLKKIDSRFVYISPLTTRELRTGETDKVHVNLDEITNLQNSGQLVALNQFYGIYYATPKRPIDDALLQNKFPILDWPLEKLEIMEKFYGDRIFTVYIQPENLEELKARLSNDGRDKDGKRYEAGMREINDIESGKYDSKFINLKLINEKGHAEEIAQLIYENFSNAVKD